MNKNILYVKDSVITEIKWYQVDLLSAALLMKIIKHIINRRSTDLTEKEVWKLTRAPKKQRIKYALKDLKDALFN